MKRRISTKEAAKLLDLPVQTLRIFLQRGKFIEFGTAVQMSSQWTYYIDSKKLNSYLDIN